MPSELAADFTSSSSIHDPPSVDVSTSAATTPSHPQPAASRPQSLNVSAVHQAKTAASHQPTPPNLRQRRPHAPARLNASPFSRPGDSPKLTATLRDFDRFLRSLPLPLHRFVPAILARLICRAFRAHNLMASNLAFDLALLFWRIIINLFFREIRPRSSWRIPKEGPVIFVAAPHHNQFLDPLLLSSEVRKASGRRVAFLIAEKSIKRKFVGAAARVMQSIPVARAADSAKPGQGTISAHPSGDPLLLQGHGTAFKSQLVPKGQVMLPKSTGYASAEVVEVISDTEIRIKKEFKDQRAVEALKGKAPAQPSRATDADAAENIQHADGPGCKYQCLPFVDQTQMYSSVYEKLAEGGCLGIFPEGGSHDRTDLLPLKAGVVIMALGAMSANPNLNVRIVPVGMSYFHPHKFRSRAVVEFGSPIDVPRELVGLFEQGGDGKKKAVGEMMDIVYDGLKGVTLRAPDYETLMVVQAGRRLYKAPGQTLSLGRTVELNRKFIMGYLKFKDEPRVMKLKEDILRYNKMLKYAGLRDHQVERATRAGWRSLGLLFYRLGLLGFWGGLALPGAVLNSPIIVLAKVISHRKAKEALAASQVKIAGRDVLATWKVLVSLGVAPVLYSFYAGLATYLAHRYQLPLKHQLLMPLYTLTVLPTMSYSALKFAEVGIDIYKSLPPLFVSLLPGNHKVILDLQRTRAQISADLHALIDELAPQVWGDFQETRLSPASEAPPANERTALLWKQKRKAGQSSDVLAHPLQWVDERLFGWGRRRGSSTRRAITSEELRATGFDRTGGSAVEDDDYSSATEGDTDDDDRDGGDYEAVFSMLNPHSLFGGGKSPATPKGRRSRSHSRSRSGSVNGGETFAEKRNRSNQDLRALLREGGAMSPTEQRTGFGEASSSTTTATANGSGGSSSAQSSAMQRRTRTHSLSDDVHVEQLRAAGPKSRSVPFSAASQAFEIQGPTRGGMQPAGIRPSLEQMKSAELTPPTTPAVSDLTMAKPLSKEDRAGQLAEVREGMATAAGDVAADAQERAEQEA
ncbi:Glycerol-3-phosphate/dihydroxyacetone phosphate acyltransferase [Thecaphora frezii]